MPEKYSSELERLIADYIAKEKQDLSHFPLREKPLPAKPLLEQRYIELEYKEFKLPKPTKPDLILSLNNPLDLSLEKPLPVILPPPFSFSKPTMEELKSLIDQKARGAFAAVAPKPSGTDYSAALKAIQDLNKNAPIVLTLNDPASKPKKPLR